MIPLRLSLSNFMSYAADSPDIDFTVFSVACLSGSNGHGKSALLDAITWVLWGQARAHSDHLVRTGQTSMAVEFDFEVDDKVYRVSRKRSRVRQGVTHTELQAVAEDGGVRSLTGQGERDTQERINRVLRMDYRAFVNSAFILQGRADEFTQQKPTERKDILAEILDLARYDRLQDLARRYQNAAQDRVRLLTAEIENLERAASHKSEYKLQLDEATQALTKARTDLNLCDSEIAVLQSGLTELEARVTLLEILRAQEQQAHKELEAAARRSDAGKKKLADLDRLLERRAEIERRLQDLQVSQRELGQLEDALQIFLTAEREERRLETELSRRRQEIEIRKTRVEASAAEIRRRADAAPKIRREIGLLLQDSHPLAELEARFEELRKASEIAAGDGTRAQAGLENVREQMELLERRRALLSESAASCPVCAQPLGSDAHARLAADLKTEKAALERRARQLEKEKQDAEGRSHAIKKEGREVREMVRRASALQQEVACLERDLSDAGAAAAALPAEEEKLASLELELAGDIDPILSGELAEVRRTREQSGYDSSRHDQLRDAVRRLTGVELEHQALEHALQSRATVAQEVQAHDVDVLEQTLKAEQIRGQMAPLVGLGQKKQELEGRQRELRSVRAQLDLQAAEAGQNVGRWQSQVEQCEEQAKQADQRREELSGASKDSAIYEELSGAFGKRGIQAMIIENAIPEIEEEANRLLGRMSDSGMHIQFQTQKEKKTGGVAETLDIVISDEMGDRPYECYSGGEAFRINFAIRIALSRLLARRAGARLQTVVVDEGFGTQDATGRRRLVEAIEAIKDEFAKILVVTHLDDIKDEFPVRLHVVKDANGSRVTLME